MKFNHDLNLIKEFPKNHTALVVINGINDKRSNIDINIMKADLDKVDLKNVHEGIFRYWEKMFSTMGAKQKYKSSVIELFETYQRENKLYSINTIVDLYNHYSLINGIPMAAYDLDKVKFPLELKRTQKGCLFTPLGNPNSKQKTTHNEVVYSDKDKIICRYWNLRDCDETKITEESNNILFIFDLVCSTVDEVDNIKNKIQNDFGKLFNENCRCLVSGSLTTSSIDL